MKSLLRKKEKKYCDGLFPHKCDHFHLFQLYNLNKAGDIKRVLNPVLRRKLLHCVLHDYPHSGDEG